MKPKQTTPLTAKVCSEEEAAAWTVLKIPTVVASDFDVKEWQENLTLPDCILCEPEPSRIIFETPRFFCLAGAGPIATGYSMIAPRAHIASIAEVGSDLFKEFQFAQQFHILLLSEIYGTAYTAYEHGRLGSCRWAESANNTGHHCFHAHRVFVAGNFELTAAVRMRFAITHALSTDAELLLTNEPYVFLEEFSPGRETSRHTFLRSDTIPSQFMRRCIASAQGFPDRWDWKRYPDWSTVRETVSLLRSAASVIQSRQIGATLNGTIETA